MDHNDTQHTWTTSLPTLSTPAWLTLAGMFLAFVGTLLPWEHDTVLGRTVATQGPMDTPAGAVLLLVLVGALGWVAWPLREGPLSKQRLIGAVLLVAALSFFVFAKVAALGHAQSTATNETASLFGNDSSTVIGGSLGVDYGPGLGLFIYGAGLLAICVGLAKAWLVDRGTALTSAPEGGYER
jgi:hypothetical protein